MKARLACGLLAALLVACGGGGGGASLAPTQALVATARAFPALSFTAPVALLRAPGDDRWFVVQQGGQVLAFADDPAASTTSTVLDFSARISSGGERGLLGLAFAPDWATSRTAYLSYTRTNGDSVLSRISSTDAGLTLDPATEEILVTVAQPFMNHNGGHLLFGPDGLLYWGLGDGGSSNDPQDNAQRTDNLLGSLVRIDVQGATLPYGIPAGNPFAGNATCSGGVGGAACPEIFAWGLRNPWRFSFDRQTGDLWLGDVGQGGWEEVDVVLAGRNFGWRDREGAHCNPALFPNGGCPAAGYTDPVAEYPNPGSASITGGYVYRGTAIPALAGDYIFGDFISGRLFRYSGGTTGSGAPEELLDTGLSIVAFAEDDASELLLVNYGGSLHHLQAAP